MPWRDITTTEQYQSLPPEQQIEQKRAYFRERVLPTIRAERTFDILTDEDIEGVWLQTPDDSGQDYFTSMLSSAGRGAASIVPGAVGGLGYLTGSETLQQAGEDIEAGIEEFLPMNPIYEDTTGAKVTGAIGQAVGFFGTGGVGGLAGKALGGARAAGKLLSAAEEASVLAKAASNVGRALSAAEKSQVLKGAAVAKATKLGAETVGLGSGILGGVREGGQTAEQYGLEGTAGYLSALGRGAIEGASEKLLFGLGTETAAVRKLLGDTLEKGAGGFAKDTLTEGAEEVFAQGAGNLLTSGLLGATGSEIEGPGLTEGMGEAFALGAVGGATFGTINALTGAYRPNALPDEIDAEQVGNDAFPEAQELINQAVPTIAETASPVAAAAVLAEVNAAATVESGVGETFTYPDDKQDESGPEFISRPGLERAAQQRLDDLRRKRDGVAPSFGETKPDGTPLPATRGVAPQYLSKEERDEIAFLEAQLEGGAEFDHAAVAQAYGKKLKTTKTGGRSTQPPAPTAPMAEVQPTDDWRGLFGRAGWVAIQNKDDAAVAQVKRLAERHRDIRRELDDAVERGAGEGEIRALKYDLVEIENAARKVAGEQEVSVGTTVTPEDQAKADAWFAERALEIEQKVARGEEITERDREEWAVAGRDPSVLPAPPEVQPTPPAAPEAPITPQPPAPAPSGAQFPAAQAPSQPTYADIARKAADVARGAQPPEVSDAVRAVIPQQEPPAPIPLTPSEAEAKGEGMTSEKAPLQPQTPQPDAVQEPSPTEGVLRQEGPELELPRVAEQDTEEAAQGASAEAEVAARTLTDVADELASLPNSAPASRVVELAQELADRHTDPVLAEQDAVGVQDILDSVYGKKSARAKELQKKLPPIIDRLRNLEPSPAPQAEPTTQTATLGEPTSRDVGVAPEQPDAPTTQAPTTEPAVPAEQAPEAAETKLPKALAESLLRNPSLVPAGPQNASFRQDVLEALTGIRPPKSQAGINRVTEELAAQYGVDLNQSTAGVRDGIKQAIRAEMQPQAASELVQGRRLTQRPDGRWQVQSEENRQRAARGEREIGGDLLYDTREEAIADTNREVELEKANQVSRQKAAEAEAEKARVQAEKEAPLNEYLSSVGGSPMQVGRLKNTLQEPAARRDSATGKVYRGTRQEVVAEMVADGWSPGTDEVPALKDKTRTQFNRMDNREQAEWEKKRAAAGTKTEYLLESGDGRNFVITKAEHDYAVWLSERSQEQAPEAAETAVTPSVLKAAETADSFSPSDAATQVYEAVKDKNPLELADWLIRNAPNEALRVIATRVREKLSQRIAAGADITIKWHTGDERPNHMSAAKGRYVSKRRFAGEQASIVVHFNGPAVVEGQLGWPSGANYTTLLHELVHAALPESALGPEFRDLFNTVVKKFNESTRESAIEQRIFKREVNALEKPEELLAWGLTDSAFQEFLASIEVPREGTAWSKFVSLIRDALGLSKKYNSALDELLRLSDGLFSESMGSTAKRVEGANEAYGFDRERAAKNVAPPGVSSDQEAHPSWALSTQGDTVYSDADGLALVKAKSLRGDDVFIARKRLPSGDVVQYRRDVDSIKADEDLSDAELAALRSVKAQVVAGAPQAPQYTEAELRRKVEEARVAGMDKKTAQDELDEYLRAGNAPEAQNAALAFLRTLKSKNPKVYGGLTVAVDLPSSASVTELFDAHWDAFTTRSTDPVTADPQPKAKNVRPKPKSRNRYAAYGSILRTKVSTKDAQRAVELETDTPGLDGTMFGTLAELRDQASNNPGLLSALDTAEREDAEAFFWPDKDGNPVAVVIVDQMAVYSLDAALARQNGTTPAVEAVRRVLRHENVGHRGWGGLPQHLRDQWLAAADELMSPEDADDLVSKGYREFADWRTNDASKAGLFEEWVARQTENPVIFANALKRANKGTLRDLLRDLWNWLTGGNAELLDPSDEQLVQLVADLLTYAGRAPAGRVMKPSLRQEISYGYEHRPRDDGPRAFDLSEDDMMPSDVYEHPEWYSAMSPRVLRETMDQLRKVRGQPDGRVTIYRAGPMGEINNGDWVSLSSEYARTHALSQDTGAYKVWSSQVAAKDVRWAMDDLAEFGYFGESVGAEDTGIRFSRKALGTSLRDLMPQETVPQTSIPDAYARAREGSSTAFISLGDILDQMSPGYPMAQFEQDIQQMVSDGTAILEPVNEVAEGMVTVRDPNTGQPGGWLYVPEQMRMSRRMPDDRVGPLTAADDADDKAAARAALPKEITVVAIEDEDDLDEDGNPMPYYIIGLGSPEEVEQWVRDDAPRDLWAIGESDEQFTQAQVHDTLYEVTLTNLLPRKEIAAIPVRQHTVRITRGMKMSRRMPVSEEMDAEYLDAVQRGDTAEAQRLVDEAVNAAVKPFTVKQERTLGADWVVSAGNSSVRVFRDPENGFWYFTDESSAGLGDIIATSKEGAIKAAISKMENSLPDGAPKTTKVPVLTDDGVRYLPGVYLRFGDLPKDGKSVRGHEPGEREKGVSVFQAWPDENGNFVISTVALEGTGGDMTDGLEGRPAYLAYGQPLDEVGADGEPLLKNVILGRPVFLSQITTDDPAYTGRSLELEDPDNEFSLGVPIDPAPNPWAATATVVRDDQGNVTPPSQRFNPESNDVRFSRPYRSQRPTFLPEDIADKLSERAARYHEADPVTGKSRRKPKAPGASTIPIDPATGFPSRIEMERTKVDTIMNVAIDIVKDLGPPGENWWNFINNPIERRAIGITDDMMYPIYTEMENQLDPTDRSLDPLRFELERFQDTGPGGSSPAGTQLAIVKHIQTHPRYAHLFAQKGMRSVKDNQIQGIVGRHINVPSAVQRVREADDAAQGEATDNVADEVALEWQLLEAGIDLQDPALREEILALNNDLIDRAYIEELLADKNLKASLSGRTPDQFAARRAALAKMSRKTLEAMKSQLDESIAKRMENISKMRTKAAPKRKGSKAKTVQEQAEDLLDRASKQQAKRKPAPNPVRDAYRDQLKRPTSREEFVKTLAGIGVDADTAGNLYDAAAAKRMALEMTKQKRRKTNLLDLTPKTAPDRAASKPSTIRGLLSKAKSELLGRMNWDTLFNHPLNTQREWRQELFNKVRADEAFANLTDQEARDLAAELDRLWNEQRQKAVERDLKKLTPSGNEEVRKRVAKATPALLRAINRGTFNESTFRTAIAPKFGIGVLSDAEMQKVSELAAKAQDMSLTRPERKQAGIDMVELLQKNTQLTKAEVLSNVWVTSVLSGPRTLFDMAFNFLNGARIVSQFAVAAATTKKGGVKSAFRGFQDYMKGLYDGIQEAIAYIISGDDALLDSTERRLNAYFGEGSRAVPVDAWGKIMRDPKSNVLNSPAAYFFGTIQRMMIAFDHVTAVSTSEGLKSLAITLNPSVYGDAQLPDANDIAAAKETAKKVIAGKLPEGANLNSLVNRGKVSSSTRQILNDVYAKRFPRLLDDVQDIGMVASFQNDPTGLGGFVYHGLLNLNNRLASSSGKFKEKGAERRQSAEEKYYRDMEAKGVKNPPPYRASAEQWLREAVGTFMFFEAVNSRNQTGLRFVRFVGNKLNEMLSFLPGMGYIRRFEDVMDENPLQKQLLQTNQVVGGMTSAALAVALWKLAFDSDDEDEESPRFMINGPWNYVKNWEQKNRLRDVGSSPNSIEIRDKDGNLTVFNYTNWPLSGLLAAVGNLIDMKRFDRETWESYDTYKLLGAGLMSTGGAVFDMNALSAFTSTFLNRDTFGRDPVGGLGDRLAKWAANYAGGFIPRMAKDIDLWQEPTYNRPEDLKDQFWKEVPFFRRTKVEGEKALNMFGEPVKVERAPWTRAVVRREVEEHHKVARQLIDKGIFFSAPNPDVRTVQVPMSNERRELTDDEAETYVTEAGRLYKNFFTSEGERVLAMPRDVAKKYIDERLRVMRNQAFIKATMR